MTGCNPYFQSCVGGSDLQSAAYMTAATLAGMKGAGDVEGRVKADAIATAMSAATFGIIPNPIQLATAPAVTLVTDNAGNYMLKEVSKAAQPITSTAAAVGNAVNNVSADISKTTQEAKNILFIVVIALILFTVIKK